MPWLKSLERSLNNVIWSNHNFRADFFNFRIKDGCNLLTFKKLNHLNLWLSRLSGFSGSRGWDFDSPIDRWNLTISLKRNIYFFKSKVQTFWYCNLKCSSDAPTWFTNKLWIGFHFSSKPHDHVYQIESLHTKLPLLQISFQVNFLAHYFLALSLVKTKPDDHHLHIVCLSSVLLK